MPRPRNGPDQISATQEGGPTPESGTDADRREPRVGGFVSLNGRRDRRQAGAGIEHRTDARTPAARNLGSWAALLLAGAGVLPPQTARAVPRAVRAPSSALSSSPTPTSHPTGTAPLAYHTTPIAAVTLSSALGCAGLWGEGPLVTVAVRDGGVALLETEEPAQLAVTDVWDPGGVLVDDVKMAGGIVYAANQSANGDLVYLFEVTPERTLLPIATIADRDRGFVPNLWVDGSHLYAAYQGREGGAVRIYDVSDPRSPVQVGEYVHPESGQTPWGVPHDLTVQDDRLYVAYLDLGFVIADVTDPSAPIEVTRHRYQDNLCESVWPSADGTRVFTTDEFPGGALTIWDVEDPDEIRPVGSFRTERGAIVHDVRVKGDVAFLSYFEEGLRILDVSEPADPVEIAFYDTDPAPVSGDYRGTWGVWPFQTTGGIGEAESLYLSNLDGTVERVEWTGNRRATIRGRVVRAGDGSPVADAEVVVSGSGRRVLADGNGSYRVELGSGRDELRYSAFAQISSTHAIDVAPFEEITVDVKLDEDETPDVVLVDDDGGAAADSVVAGWTEELGLRWARWDTALHGGLSPVRLSRFGQPTAVVWITGPNREDPLDPAERDSLARVLDAGHPTLLTGQFVGDVLADTAWLESRFGARHRTDEVEVPVLEGVVEDPITDGMVLSLDRTGGPNDQSSAGAADPVGAGAFPLLHYASLEESFAGIRAEWAGRARTVFLEFGLEGVRDAPGVTSPVEFLGSILTYLGAPVGIGGRSPAPRPPGPGPTLAQNVPNPFNPSTRIAFTLPGRGATPAGGPGEDRVEASVVVYDARGRVVRTLLDESLSPGTHTVRWNGRSDSGAALPSGRYIVRLSACGREVERTVLLLK